MNGIKKRIQNLFKRRQDVKKYGLEECYSHKGIKLYNFNNPLELPYFRYLKVMAAINQSALKAQVSDVIAYTELVDDFARNKDFESILKYSQYLRAFVDLDYTNTLLFNIAEPLLMMEGEQPDDESNEWSRKKKEMFTNYDHVKAFFLRMGFGYLMTFQNQSIGHLRIEDYLKREEVKKAEEIFLAINSREHLQEFINKMNIEMYALSKRTGKSDNELMKMKVGEYYELYLTDKTYHQMIRQEMDKK